MDLEKTKYGKRLIKDFDHWTCYLHPNQSYLGRLFISLKRSEEDFTNLTKEEVDELFLILRKIRNSLMSAFSSDRLNYAVFGNEIAQLHMHVVPRYSKPKEFSGVVFRDDRWGKNYSPYDKSFQVSDEVMDSIVNKIKENLS